MSLTVITAGQYGGEGKGLISAYLTWKEGFKWLVKTGGPNSSHSFYFKGKLYKVRMLPAGAIINPMATIVYPAGCLLYPPQLQKEIQEHQFQGRILIDRQTGIITDEVIYIQQKDPYYESVGSTLTGTGYANANRAKRRLLLAKDADEQLSIIPDLFELVDTKALLEKAYNSKNKILIEGCQAYGLSNYHGQYPYVSSRDNTVNALMSQVGLGPKFVDRILLVIKCFPTRNRHGKGELLHELDDRFLEKAEPVLYEYGGGNYEHGDLRRRVGLFNMKLLKEAIRANTPDGLVVTGLDKVKDLMHLNEIKDWYKSPEEFLDEIEAEVNVNVVISNWGNSLESVKELIKSPITKSPQ